MRTDRTGSGKLAHPSPGVVVQHRRLSGTDVQLVSAIPARMFWRARERSLWICPRINSSTSPSRFVSSFVESFLMLEPRRIFSARRLHHRWPWSRGSNHFNRDSTASDSICVEVTVLADCFPRVVTLTMILGMSRESAELSNKCVRPPVLGTSRRLTTVRILREHLTAETVY